MTPGCVCLYRGQPEFTQSPKRVTYELGAQPGLAWVGVRVGVRREEVILWDMAETEFRPTELPPPSSPTVCKLVAVISPNLDWEAGR